MSQKKTAAIWGGSPAAVMGAFTKINKTLVVFHYGQR